MATVKISNLPPAPPGTGSGSSQGTDLFPATDTTDTTSASSGTTKKYTLAEIFNWMLAAQGLTVYDAVQVATTGALTTTYDNGVAGVGATLTNATTQAILAIDGVTMSVGSRVLVWQQVDDTHNGIYFVTDVGSSSTNWVLTRAGDYNQPDDIVQYGVVLVNQGSTYAGRLFQETAAGPFVIGTSAITFDLYSFASGFISSITGTLSEVLVNGTFGAAVTGAVTLTTPQPIGLISSPTFVNLTLTGGNIFDANSNEILALTPVASAVNYLEIGNNTTTNPPGLIATGSDTNISLSIVTQGTGSVVFTAEGGGVPLLTLAPVASAVNYLQITNSITTVPPSISALGSDTNINLNLIPKGTGAVELLTTALTNPLVIVNGTGGQHVTNFFFANSNASRSVTFPDATGTVLLTAGTQQLASGASLFLDKGTGTESSNAVTINKQSGVITTVSLTTAQYATEVITLTNSEISTSSVVLVSVMGGSNTTPGITLSATAGSGSSVITLTNLNTAALNGTVFIGFAVF